MMKKISLVLAYLLFFINTHAQYYKSLMHDYSVNLYDVKKEADKHFASAGTGKGTGYKAFMRWYHDQNMLFFPSGDRSKFNPYQSVEAYASIKRSEENTSRTINNSWTDLGPYNANNISTHYAPGIGRIECVYVDPLNTNTIYISSRSGGLWKSTNGGTSWSHKTATLPVSGVNTFAVNPQNINDILINIESSNHEISFGIYRSTDGGNNWALTAFNPGAIGVGGWGTAERVKQITWHPTRNDTIYVASTEGLYRSLNNFTNINLSLAGSFGQVKVHPTSPDVLYASYDYYWDRNKLMKSTNAGGTWTNIQTFAANDYAYPTLSTTKANANTIFFTSGNGIWKSTDSGASFVSIPASGFDKGAFGVSDVNADVLLYGNIDVYRTSDSGNNWIKATEWYKPNATSTNYVHADLRYVYSLNGVFYIGTDGYLAKSTDNGISWTRLSDGVAVRENYRLGVSQSDYDRVSCGSQDNGSSYYKDGSWVEWVGADGMEQVVHSLNPDYVIGNIQFGGKFKTTDGAVTGGWYDNSTDNMDWLAPCSYNPNSFDIVYALGAKLHRSNDFGVTYNVIYNFGTTMTQMAIAENNSNIILASRNELLYKSTNGGISFTQIGAGVLPNYYISDIAFDPKNDNIFMLTYSNHEINSNRIMITTNGGTSFSSATHNLTEIPVHSIVFDHVNNYIYAGTETGVFAKTRTGMSWTSFNTNLPPVAIKELEIQYASNQLYAASWGRGLWVNKLINRQNHPVIKEVKSLVNTVGGVNINSSNKFIQFSLANSTNVTSTFVKYSINNTILNTTIAVYKLNKTTYDFEMPGGAIGDSIYFKIFVVGNNNDTTESYRYMYKLRGQSSVYCFAQGSSGTGADFITKVTFGSQENTSGQNQYTYYSGVVFNINQFENKTVKVQLQFAFSPDDAGVWVDWDNSNTFEAAEAVVMSPYNVSSESTGTISPPPGTEPGTYRMRARNSYFGPPTPCGEDAGEVEDYVVQVNTACSSNPIVTTINDRNIGSLRYWVDATCINDTIYFHNNIVNDSLILYSHTITPSKALTIMGPTNGFVISGNNNLQSFSFSQPTNLVNLTLVNNKKTINGGAFYNSSPVTLRNVKMKNNYQGPVPKAFTNINNVSVLSGASEIRQ